MPATPLTNATSLDRRALIVLLLAVSGGGVDAIVILGFGVLTAAQTGNTVLLAVAFAQGRVAAGLLSAVSLVGYITGAAVGELVIVGRRAAEPPAAVGRTLVAEILTLGSLIILWQLTGPKPAHGAIEILVALAAIAMGIQSAAALRLGAGPTTTYVTGMLTTFTTELIRRLHLVEAAPVASLTPPGPRLKNSVMGGAPWLSAVTWAAYGAGAFVGGLLFLRAGGMALLLPIAALVIAALAMTRQQRS